MRDLFSEARKRATAIIFIDEIDAIGQRRSGSGAAVANDEREQTLNQLLAEMDGFDVVQGIVVLAATNRPEILNPALLRPGRFDRQVRIPLPTLTERVAILAVHSARARMCSCQRRVEFGQGSTGAANDLASATDLATKMVREFGLSPALGPVGYPEGGSVFLGGGGSGLSSRPFAEAIQAKIDSEVARLLCEAEQAAVDLLRSHRPELEQLVDLLLEHETVDGSAVYRIVGKPVPEHSPGEMAIAPRAKAAASAVARDGSGPGASPG